MNLTSVVAGSLDSVARRARAAESVLHINVTCRDSNLHRSQVYDADITIAWLAKHIKA